MRISVLASALLAGLSAGSPAFAQDEGAEELVAKLGTGSDSSRADAAARIIRSGGRMIEAYRKAKAGKSAEEIAAARANIDRLSRVLNETCLNADEVLRERVDAVRSKLRRLTGAKIAFSAMLGGKKSIYVLYIEDGYAIRLTDGSDDCFAPCWSPDGTRLCFSRARNKETRAFAMDSDGANVVPLSTGSGLSPVWSPDSTRVAFVSSCKDGAEIYTADALGRDETRLTADPGAKTSPAWSPDGRRIAFVLHRDKKRILHLVGAEGGPAFPLWPEGADDFDPAWNPDGSRIAFATGRYGQGQICVGPADGGYFKRLTTSGFADRKPVWSPDGKSVMFTSYRNGENHIYLIDAMGGEERGLTDPLIRGYFWNPSWCPTGRRIVYERSVEL